MRVAVLSDIHANMDALAAVLADMEGKGINRMVSLGDNIGYGPEPEQVMKALADHGIVSVLGNHERALLDPVFALGFNPGARTALEINRQLLSRASLDMMADFPFFLILEGARFVHGVPPDLIDRYIHKQPLSTLVHIMDAQPESLSFVGHSHRLETYMSGPEGILVKKMEPPRLSLAKACKYIINSGSVGQPRDGCCNAVYLVWDSARQEIESRPVAYDAARTVRLMADLGIPRAYGDLLLGQAASNPKR